MFELWTDGASSRNGAVDCAGGWGYILLRSGKEEFRGSGHEKPSSNQRMELTAAIKGLQYFTTISDGEVTVFSDSAYLINCYKQNWWKNWERNGWVNSKRQPVANKELWEALIPFFKNTNIHWEKVSGHSGVKWNEEVDKLAVAAKKQGDI